MTYTLDDYFKAAKLKNTVPFAPYITMRPDRIPMEHQVKGLNKLLTHDNWGLYDEPGTGKTLIVHAYAMFWISEGQKVLAIMPPNLVYQFKEELFGIYKGADKYLQCHILDQNPRQRRRLYQEWEANNSWPQIMCMSYQMFQREYKTFMSEYRVGLFDEAQALKNSTSGIYKLVKKWQEQKGGTAVVPMTGTPIHNELIDAYALIDLTDPGAYKNFKDFDNQHCVYKKIRLREPRRTKSGRMMYSFRQRSGYKNVTKLSKALYRRASRVLKKDVGEIRAPTVTEIPVKLDAGHLALYKKLVKERLLEFGDDIIIADNAQSLRQKCLQIVTCPELFVEEMKFKNNVIKTVQELIDGMDVQSTKIIVFCNYQDSVRNLAQYFEHLNPALMYGASNTEKNRQKFLHDKTCRMLIANPQSAGAGFNFQDVSHTIVFAEPTGVPGDFKQCKDRVDRWGQKNLVNIYIVKALGTISPKATKEMLRKETDAQEVYHDRHTFLSEFKVA